MARPPLADTARRPRSFTRAILALAILPGLVAPRALAQPINTSAPRTPAEPDSRQVGADRNTVTTPAAVTTPPTPAVPDPGLDPFTETAAQHDARMAWWRDARFGMFIHWGLYAIPAGQWGDSTDHAEWIRTTAQIPLDQYEQLVPRFNPVNFDARAWARMARQAGMKYIVITTKHHDGFCLFDSKVTDFDVMSTPFHRDIIREVVDAARDEGLQIGFYYSIMDWHHPDYLPRRPWETDRPPGNADFARYVQYLHAQVTELLTNYGPIGVMWFDGEWEDTWNQDLGRDLYALCRRLQPAIIVNNRVAKARDGMAGLSMAGQFAGDFGTPEQEVPATGIPGVDWESCMTMNDHWGYNAFDTRWKSARTLVRTLVDIASKGGNFLLNVGPRSDGTFPPEAVDRLNDIAAWMDTNALAIHATRQSPFESLPWGRCTINPRVAPPGSIAMFLHVFDWPPDGRLLLPGLAAREISARLLGQQDDAPSSVKAERVGADVVISALPSRPPDPDCPVIALLVDDQSAVYVPPRLSAPSSEFTDSLTVTLAHPRSTDEHPLDLRYTLNNSDPTADSPSYDGPLVLHDTTTVRVQAWAGRTPLSPVASQTFEKVTPLPAVTLRAPAPGYLNCDHYEGTWDRMPRFDALTPVKSDQTRGLTLDTRTRDEHFAQRFTGYLYIKAEGVYRFSLASDDGSRLYLHDRLVVDNDGLHVTEARQGAVALAPGWHPITVEYFNRSGQRSLSLRGEIVGRDLVDIPPRAFALESQP